MNAPSDSVQYNLKHDPERWCWEKRNLLLASARLP